MNPFRRNLLARGLMLAVALLLIAATGVLSWVVKQRIDNAHLEAITDMLVARETGERIFADMAAHCAEYPGTCEQLEKLGPISTRADLKQLFAPLYLPHMSAASARRIAAAFDGAAGRLANRAQREGKMRKSAYWASLSGGQRDAIEALLASEAGVADQEAWKLVLTPVYDRYTDMLMEEQTRMLSAPWMTISAYAKQYEAYAGDTPPPPVVLEPVGNRYFEQRAHILAASASKMALAFWVFKRAGGALLAQVREEVALDDRESMARAVSALQQLKPDFERYLRARDAIYQERFQASVRLERASTGGGAKPDLAPFEKRLATDMASLAADRRWFALAERVYVGARDHPYLVKPGVPKPAQTDSAFEQRFAQDRAALEQINSESRENSARRDALRDTIIAGKLGDLLDPDAAP